MAVRYPAGTRDAITDLVVDRVDAGAGAGKLRIYSGTQPAAGATATGTLLVEFTFGDPAFGASSTGTGTANAIAATTGLDDGTAGWFRVLDSDDNIVWDGAAAELGMNTTTISTGVDVEVTSLTYTTPNGD